jgi:type I restriction enzyme S subunit
MKNWQIFNLGDLLTESKVESRTPNAKKRIRVKLNLGGVEKRPEFADKEGATKYYIRSAGQFIFGRQNLHKGAFGIVPDDLDGYESSSDIPAFDVDDLCYPMWIYYFFKQNKFFLKLESLTQGVGSKRISNKNLFDLKILLPSKSEQREILDLIFELEERSAKLSSQIEYQLSLINRLKKVIVKEGLLGDLTRDWRSNFSSITSENLINEIRLQKAQLILEKKIPKERISLSLKPIRSSQTLPKNWVWCSFGELMLEIEAGKSPFCDPYPAEIDRWGVIKISAVSWGKFLEDENKSLPLNLTPFIDKEIKPGDFILSRANTSDLVARSVIVHANVRSKLLLNDKTLRIKFTNLCDLNYINYFNNSVIARAYYLDVASGTSDSMKNISRDHLKYQIFPLAPYEEQKKISTILDNLLKRYGDLEEQITFTKSNFEQFVNVSIAGFLRCDENELNLIPSIKPAFERQKTAVNINAAKNNSGNNMELEELLVNGKMSALNLWKMSKFQDNIDSFYAELKLLIEEKGVIRESKEKGFLELNK